MAHEVVARQRRGKGPRGKREIRARRRADQKAHLDAQRATAPLARRPAKKPTL
jgi:hypothetical protein